MARRNDMNDEPRDFLAIKGPGRLKIEPQTKRGWLLGGLWTLLVLLPTVPLVILGAHVDDTPQEYWALLALIPHLALTGLIAWAMVRWMLARADVVTTEELKDFIRQRRDGSDRGRR